MLSSALFFGQALPPMGMVALAAWMLFGVPLAFGVAIVALVISLVSSARHRAVRWLGGLGLVLGVIDLGLAAVWWRLDRNPVPLGAEGAVELAMLAATPVLAAVALWRSAKRLGSRTEAGSSAART